MQSVAVYQFRHAALDRRRRNVVEVVCPLGQSLRFCSAERQVKGEAALTVSPFAYVLGVFVVAALPGRRRGAIAPALDVGDQPATSLP